MRLWAAAVDYTEDVRCSDEILNRVTDAYRKFRNTLRYALGNLDGFNPETDNVSYQEMLEIDRWALAGFDEAARKILEGYETYNFQSVYQTIYNLFTVTLSQRYFDIIKDRLYIYAPKVVGTPFGANRALRDHGQNVPSARADSRVYGGRSV